MTDEQETLLHIIEAALFAADAPLTVEQLQALFDEEAAPSKEAINNALAVLVTDYENRGVQLVHLANGYRFQTRSTLAQWVHKLWEEKPPRLSRAVLETLALMAYRQPITRGEIEEIRGVAVSSHIVRTLTERGWIRVVGHKEVPGRPALYATTNEFLTYFNLASLEELPTLAELQSITLEEEQQKEAQALARADENNTQQEEVIQANIAEQNPLDSLEEIDMDAVDLVLEEFDQRFKAGQSFEHEDIEARSESLPLEP